MPIVLVLLILVGLIVAHELGHFFAAKLFNVRVDEFGVGYPPRAFTLWKGNETEYTLNWLPFGGFVRLFGENAEAAGHDKHRAFVHAKPWKQAIILVAGVAMNAVCAYLLFVAALMSGMLSTVPDTQGATLPEGAHLVISQVLPGSPAGIAGLMTGDEILALVDESGTAPLTLAPDNVVSFIQEHAGKELSLVYKRQNATSTTMLSPAQAVIEGSEHQPAIGVALAVVAPVHLSFTEAVVQGWSYTVSAFSVSLSGLYTLIHDSIFGKPDLSQVVGPVGLVGVVADAEGHGFGYLLELAAIIAINLTIINLIPLPALDGGRLVVVGIEALARRKIPAFGVDIANALGFLAIVAFMGFVTWNDIINLIK